MKIPAITLLACCISLVGCGVPPIDKSTKDAEDKKTQQLRARMSNSTITAPKPSVVLSNKPIIPVVSSQPSIKESQTSWLQSRRVMLNIDKPIPMSEVVKMLWSQGINITSTLPLDSYTYGGLGVNNTDAETALKLIMSSVGLDFELDNARKIVLVKPMESRTWYLNLGNRSSTFSSGSTGGATSTTQVSSTSQSAGSGTTNQNASTVSSNIQNAGTSGTAISSSDNFWVTLKAELTSRLSVLVPNSTQRSGGFVGGNPSPLPTPLNAPIPANTQVNQPQAGNAGSLYTSKQIGTFSLNPETGAIYVQAPHWILDGLNTYLNRIQDMYNTDITFTGELVMLTTDSGSTEGLDISSFGRYANSNYGFGFKNNALGGVTVSVPDGGTPTITAGKAELGSTLIGIKNLTNGFQIFNSYLSNHGTVSIVQKPVISTTSGVPAEVSNIVTRYFNSSSQLTSQGGAVGGATMGTQNTLVPVDLGVVIKINPRIDLSTGLIRAQISLGQTINSGTQTINQQLNAGNTLQQVQVPIPIVTKMNYSGEVLLQDGDMIIVGGQQDDVSNTNSNGVTGLKDTFAGGIFGTKDKTRRTSTYYFALRVTTNKR